ncbi:MAG: hypothetical protein AAF623_05265 [Planctomycetota bacterium]
MPLSRSERLKRWYRRTRNNPDVDHYSMLGIELFESDLQRIEAAAEERVHVLQKMSNQGIDSDQAKELAKRVVLAKLCLANVAKRNKYDRELKVKLEQNDLNSLHFYLDGHYVDDSRTQGWPCGQYENPTGTDQSALRFGIIQSNTSSWTT